MGNEDGHANDGISFENQRMSHNEERDDVHTISSWVMVRVTNLYLVIFSAMRSTSA